MSLITSQPGKAIWTLLAITFNAARLPFWIVLYIFPFMRQSPSFTWRQALRVSIVRAFLYNAAMVEMKTPLSLKPGREKDRFVVVAPAQPSYYAGVASCDPAIKPQEIGGTWYPAVPSPSSITKPGYVVLHFHGGAYVIGDGRTHDAGFAAKTMLAKTPATHVFAPQYRLASNPGGRFPAALQDAITTYAYLVFVQGIHPSKIIVSGDSAGGNLVYALLRHIAEHGTKLGLLAPGAAFLWSPWSNIGHTHNNPTVMDLNPNRMRDYVGPHFGAWGARSFEPAKNTGIDIWNPAISHTNHPFHIETPLWITAGEFEVLLPEIIQFAEQMRKTKGNVVELDIQRGAVHDIILVGRLTAFEKEAEAAAKRAGDWLREVKKL